MYTQTHPSGDQYDWWMDRTPKNPMHTLYRFFGLMLLLLVLSFAWTAVHAADERAGAVQIVQALQSYPVYCDHPG